MFVKHGYPWRNKVKIWQKSLSPTFWPRPTPRSMGCHWSVRNPWMNLQSKFGYCIITQTLIIGLCFYAGRNYGQTNRQTDGGTDGRTNWQMDNPITRYPRQTFQAGGIKMMLQLNIWIVIQFNMCDDSQNKAKNIIFNTAKFLHSRYSWKVLEEVDVRKFRIWWHPDFVEVIGHTHCHQGGAPSSWHSFLSGLHGYT